VKSLSFGKEKGSTVRPTRLSPPWRHQIAPGSPEKSFWARESNTTAISAKRRARKFETVIVEGEDSWEKNILIVLTSSISSELLQGEKRRKRRQLGLA